MLTELTFLRPIWFFALIPAILLLGLIWLKENESSSWHKLIYEKYHPYLLGKSDNKTNLGVYFLALAWLIAIIALAGPSLHKQPLPAQKSQAGSVIILDLSLSMLADDIKPNRLTRVHFLLRDLLKDYPELTLGMVGYSGSAHIISPIAEDNSTLSNLVMHLNPLIMPSYGADAVAAFNLAKEMLDNSNITQGHLIWITDDLEEAEFNPIKNLVKNNDLSLSIVAVGTKAGAPIKIAGEGLLKDLDGKIVNTQPPFKLIQQLAKTLKADYQQLTQATPTHSKILPKNLAEKTRKVDEKQRFQAIDSGLYLLAPLVFLAAFGLRRGWLGIVVLALVPLGGTYSPNSFADEEKPQVKFNDRWSQIYLTDDQRGYQAWENQDYIAAEIEFADQQWKAAALYKQQKYAEALELFKKDSSAQGFYNQGNSLVKMGQLEAAQKAYADALKLDPNLGVAQKNKAIVDKLLNEKPENKSQEEDKDSSETNPMSNQEPQDEPKEEAQDKPGKEQEEKEDEQKNNQEDNKKPQTAGDATEDSAQEDSQNTEDAENTQDAQDTKKNLSPTESDNINSAEDDENTAGIVAEEDAAEDDLAEEGRADLNSNEAEQAMENWLNQVEDNPGIFLQRKFDHQYQNNINQPSKKSNKQW